MDKTLQGGKIMNLREQIKNYILFDEAEETIKNHIC